MNSLVQQRLRLLDDLCYLALAHLFELVGDLPIELRIKHGILLGEVGLFNDDGNFFEFIITIVRVVLHDAREDFREVSIQIILGAGAKFLLLLELTENRHQLGISFN